MFRSGATPALRRGHHGGGRAALGAVKCPWGSRGGAPAGMTAARPRINPLRVGLSGEPSACSSLGNTRACEPMLRQACASGRSQCQLQRRGSQRTTVFGCISARSRGDSVQLKKAKSVVSALGLEPRTYRSKVCGRKEADGTSTPFLWRLALKRSRYGACPPCIERCSSAVC